MLKKLKKLSSKEKFRNKWWAYIIDEYEWPTGDIGEYHFVRTTGSTMIIPKLKDDIFIMTKQFRYLNQKESIEFPGGSIKQGLLPEQNALEELEEEAGFICSAVTELGKFNPYNGVTDEICTVFLAEGLSQTELKPEPSEEFEIMQLSFNQINQKIATGEIWDGMTLASWAVFLSRSEK